MVDHHCSSYKKSGLEGIGDKNAIYTCPMHSKIRQKGPGNCPICGMALEPEIITGEEGENPELTDFRHRFWIGLVLAIPVFYLKWGGIFLI